MAPTWQGHHVILGHRTTQHRTHQLLLTTGNSWQEWSPVQQGGSCTIQQPHTGLSQHVAHTACARWSAPDQHDCCTAYQAFKNFVRRRLPLWCCAQQSLSATQLSSQTFQLQRCRLLILLSQLYGHFSKSNSTVCRHDATAL